MASAMECSRASLWFGVGVKSFFAILGLVLLVSAGVIMLINASWWPTYPMVGSGGVLGVVAGWWLRLAQVRAGEARVRAMALRAIEVGAHTIGVQSLVMMLDHRTTTEAWQRLCQEEEKLWEQRYLCGEASDF